MIGKSIPRWVLRLAGILPPENQESENETDDESIRQINLLLKKLSPENRQQLLEYLMFLYQRQGKK